MSLRDRRVLVTGAKGRIGSAVVARLAGLGADVVPADLPEVDTTDPEAVAAIMVGVDLVVHLAAIPGPKEGHWPEVFATNVTSTFNVLHAAGEHGVRRVMIASSINATGVPFNSHRLPPAYLPFDERLPHDIEDPYSLSKSVDEQSGAAMARRFGIEVVAIRFPLVMAHEILVRRSEELRSDPAPVLNEGWTYLDVRDAARVAELALTRPITGAQTIFVCADETLVPYATEDLLDRYAPDVLRLRRFVGREVPADLTRARSLLGFRAEYVLDLPTLPLP